MKIPVLAAAALCLLAGCAGFDGPGIGGEVPAREHVLKGDILFRNGSYTGALLEYERYLEDPDAEFADKALFRIGYIHLFYDKNPGGPEKARLTFMKLMDEFPNSPRSPEAENLMETLDRIRKLEKENLKLRADLQKMLDLDIQLEEKRKALQ